MWLRDAWVGYGVGGVGISKRRGKSGIRGLMFFVVWRRWRGMSDESIKKKWWKRRWVFWCVWMIPFTLIFVLWLVFGIWKWNEQRKWNAVLEELAHWGESVNIDDFPLEAVPDEQNVLADPWFTKLRQDPNIHTVSAIILGLKEDDFSDGDEFYFLGWEDPSPKRRQRFVVARDSFDQPVSDEENIKHAHEYLRRFEGNTDAAKHLDRLFSLSYWQDPKTGTHQDRNELNNEYSLMIDMMRLQGRLAAMYALTAQPDKAMHHLRQFAVIDQWLSGQNILIGDLVRQVNQGLFVEFVWELLQCESIREEELSEIARLLQGGGQGNTGILNSLRAETAYSISQLLDADAELLAAVLDMDKGLSFTSDVSLRSKIKGYVIGLEPHRLRNCRAIVQLRIPCIRQYEDGDIEGSLHRLGQVMDERTEKKFRGADDKFFNSLEIAQMTLTGYGDFLTAATKSQAY